MWWLRQLTTHWNKIKMAVGCSYSFISYFGLPCVKETKLLICGIDRKHTFVSILYMLWTNGKSVVASGCFCRLPCKLCRQSKLCRRAKSPQRSIHTKQNMYESKPKKTRAEKDKRRKHEKTTPNINQVEQTRYTEQSELFSLSLLFFSPILCMFSVRFHPRFTYMSLCGKTCHFLHTQYMVYRNIPLFHTGIYCKFRLSDLVFFLYFPEYGLYIHYFHVCFFDHVSKLCYFCIADYFDCMCM